MPVIQVWGGRGWRDWGLTSLASQSGRSVSSRFDERLSKNIRYRSDSGSHLMLVPGPCIHMNTYMYLHTYMSPHIHSSSFTLMTTNECQVNITAWQDIYEEIKSHLTVNIHDLPIKKKIYMGSIQYRLRSCWWEIFTHSSGSMMQSPGGSEMGCDESGMTMPAP